MIRFLDGPAAGSSLNLSRAPLFLRVVINARGVVDALDLSADQAEPDESIYAYRLNANLGSGFVCSRGRGCKLLVMAEYILHDTQPTDETARDLEKWPAWALAQAEAGGYKACPTTGAN